MNQKRTWIYCRVASSAPNSLELLEYQRSRLEDYARCKGFQIIGSSSDIGNGMTIKRPGVWELMEAANDEAVDILLLANLDRLSRDYRLNFWCWQMLRGRGIRIHTAKEGDVELQPVCEVGLLLDF